MYGTAITALQNIMGVEANDTMTNAEKLDSIRQLATDGVVDSITELNANQESSGD